VRGAAFVLHFCFPPVLASPALLLFVAVLFFAAAV
jgi:hypothetical protein